MPKQKLWLFGAFSQTDGEPFIIIIATHLTPSSPSAPRLDHAHSQYLKEKKKKQQQQIPSYPHASTYYVGMVYTTLTTRSEKILYGYSSRKKMSESVLNLVLKF